jgi:hypothetical protein
MLRLRQGQNRVINKEMMKNRTILAILGLCLVMSACSPTGVGNSPSGSSPSSDSSEAAAWSKVAELTNESNDMREVMKAKVGDRDVVAVLQWRPYNGRRDALQATWYGDMNSPPPTYVAESLIISVNGRGLMVPSSQTRYLCSQWMNTNPRLGLYLKGSSLCIYVTVGDGSDAWCASYIVNPETGALVSHNVERASKFHRKTKLR